MLKSLKLLFILYLFFCFPGFSPRASIYLAPQTNAHSELDQLLQPLRKGDFYYSEEEGYSLDEFLSTFSAHLKDSNQEIIRVLIANQILVHYIHLFQRVLKEQYLPNLSEKVWFRLLANTARPEHLKDIRVLLPHSMEYIDLTKISSFEKRDLAISRFVFSLYEFAIKNNVNPDYFLKNLFSHSTLPEKRRILNSLKAGIEQLAETPYSPVFRKQLQAFLGELFDTSVAQVQDPAPPLHLDLTSLSTSRTSSSI